MKRLKKPLKFLVAGVTAAVTEYVAFMALLLISHVIFANTVSFCLGLLVSYHLNRHWVFNSGGGATRFGAYVLLAMMNLLLSNIIVLALTENISVNVYIAKFIAMGMIAVWNYLIFSKLLFRNRSSTP